MKDLVPEEVILRLEAELDQYANTKAHLPRLCADSCEVIRKLIADVEIVLEVNKGLTGLLSKKYHGDKKIVDIMARLKAKG